jgi:hypothetical protein
MNKTLLIFAALSAAVPSLALATGTPTIPEPESLALLAIGAVAFVVARVRRRKDK